jgi:hypothetical protein
MTSNGTLKDGCDERHDVRFRKRWRCLLRVMGCRSDYVGVTTAVPQIAADSLHSPSRPSRVTGCLCDYVGITTAVPQIAADSLERPSCQGWANGGHIRHADDVQQDCRDGFGSRRNTAILGVGPFPYSLNRDMLSTWHFQADDGCRRQASNFVSGHRRRDLPPVTCKCWSGRES